MGLESQTMMSEEAEKIDLRRSGIGVVGEVPWGTHFCQFYETPGDLIEILVPYFREGLLANEFCMWVTSAPLQVEEAIAALRTAVPDLDDRLARGQIEVLDFSQWYTRSGSFAASTVLKGWVDKLTNALKKGYAGLRLTGNTFWLEETDWEDFTRYEEAVNNVIGRYQMLAVCTYSLDKCGASEIIDVVNNHQFALIKRRGKWTTMQGGPIRQMEEISDRPKTFPTGKPKAPAKILAILVALSGAAVMLGWICNIGILKSISPSWITMKFSTAIAFVISGATLYFLFLARQGEFEKAQVALSITSLMLCLLMGLLFFSSLFKVQTGIEDMFMKDTPGSAYTLVPGRPSVPTMVNFLLIGLTAILAILNPPRLLLNLKAIGIVIGVIGMIALIGYMFNVPLLYYYLPNLNSAMAIHTAALFACLGVGLLCL